MYCSRSWCILRWKWCKPSPALDHPPPARLSSRSQPHPSSQPAIQTLSYLCFCPNPKPAFQPVSPCPSLAPLRPSDSLPAPGCDAVTCMPVQWDCPCPNVFTHWGDYKETACRGQAAAVSYRSQQLGGTTAGCRGVGVDLWPGSSSQAKPMDGLRPGRIRP